LSALRISAIVTACGALVACAQLVGIGDFPGATSDAGDAGDAGNDVNGFDAPSSSCDTPIMTLSSANRIDVASGFVFVQGDNYIGRCSVAGTCTDPTNLLTLGTTDVFASASIGTSISYTVQDTSGGSVRSMALDGNQPTTLFTSSGLPNAIALSGTNTFWIDDATSAVHCIGCAGADAPWITMISSPIALFADETSVYVLSDDGQGTLGIYSCGSAAPCASSPPLVIDGVATNVTASMVASDGAAVYVAELGNILRVQSLGSAKPVVQGVQVSALAVDGTTHEIAYTTSTGEIDIAPTDGSLTHRALATCAGAITWLAIDATNVYVLVQNATTWSVYAIKR
jgi:hypothetical protein